MSDIGIYRQLLVNHVAGASHLFRSSSVIGVGGPIAKPDKVRLSKPNAATFTLSVDEVQISWGVVALFFLD
jgi:hypothetical protein